MNLYRAVLRIEYGSVFIKAEKLAGKIKGKLKKFFAKTC